MMRTSLNDVVRDALNEHRRKLPLRSEAIDGERYSYLGLSADGANLTRLENSDWQVVYGRRGTGKTHLLRSFEELKRSALNSPRDQRLDFCFYFSAQDFLVSQDQMQEEKRALAYFQVFIEQFTNKVLSFVDELIRSTSTFDRLLGRSRALRADVEELALKIGEVSRYGESLASAGELQRSREKSSSSGGKVGGDVKVGLDGKTFQPAIAASLSVSGEEAHGETRKESFSTKGGTTPRFDQVKPLLLQLLDSLSINRAFILIDEWPLLDPSGLLNIQPAFASLLKKTFAGTGRLSIKIAANRFQTQFAARDELGTLIGLELDADIFEAVNLDHAMLAEIELESFYATMIFKRLCYCSPLFAQQMLPSHGDLDEVLQSIHEAPNGFVELIFKDRVAFQELTRGCEGIPRDFLDLFNRASAKRELHSLGDRWSIGIVRDVISESRLASAQNDLEYNSPSYRLLNITIRRLVVASGRREFAIHIDDHQSFSSLIDILLEKRIVHEYPIEKIPDELREFKIYLTDYGYCLDWVRAYQQHHGTPSDDEFFFSAGGMSHEMIGLIHLESDCLIRDKVVPDRKVCGHCKKGFSPEAAAYVKKRLCPNCFETVD